MRMHVICMTFYIIIIIIVQLGKSVGIWAQEIRLKWCCTNG